MAHQAVEVEGRGHAGIDLVIRDLRFNPHGGRNFARGLGGPFQRAAFRHVEDDLELALVVERQHLHFDPTDAHQGHRTEQQPHDTRQKQVAPAPSAINSAMKRR